jgi:hypothetical protein
MTDTIDREAVLAEERRLRKVQINVETRLDQLKARHADLEQTIKIGKAAIAAEAHKAAAAGRDAEVDDHHRAVGEAQAELVRVKAEQDGIDFKAPVEAIRRHRVRHLGVYADLAEAKTQAALAAIERARAAYTEAHAAWVEANAEWGDLVRDHNRRAPTEMKFAHPPVYDWRTVEQTFEMPVPRCPSFEPVSVEEAEAA